MSVLSQRTCLPRFGKVLPRGFPLQVALQPRHFYREFTARRIYVPLGPLNPDWQGLSPKNSSTSILNQVTKVDMLPRSLPHIFECYPKRPPSYPKRLNGKIMSSLSCYEATHINKIQRKSKGLAAYLNKNRAHYVIDLNTKVCESFALNLNFFRSQFFNMYVCILLYDECPTNTCVICWDPIMYRVLINLWWFFIFIIIVGML